MKMISVSGRGGGSFGNVYSSSDLFDETMTRTSGRSMMDQALEGTQGRSRLQESMWETARSGGLPPRGTMDAFRAAYLARGLGRFNPWLSLALAIAEGAFGWARQSSGPDVWNLAPGFPCYFGGLQPNLNCAKVNGAQDGFFPVATSQDPAVWCSGPWSGASCIDLPLGPNYHLPFTKVQFTTYLPGAEYSLDLISPSSDGKHRFTGVMLFVRSQWDGNSVPRYGPSQRVAPLPLPAPPVSAEKERSYGESSRRRAVRPYQVAARTVVLGPRGAGDGPPVHDVLPPAAGDVEDKFKFKTSTKLQKAFGKLTEVSDIMDCMVNNISVSVLKNGKEHKIYPCRYISDPVARAKCIASQAGNLDLVGFGKCIAEQAVQDEVVGRLASGANRQYFKSGYAPKSPHGLNFHGYRSQRMR